MNDLHQSLWKKVKRYVPLLRFVPFLRGVAVCNNLAFATAKAGSDIDLFIIAKEGRLFMVRTFVTFIFQILGVRRHEKKIAGRFCLSFFVDDSALDLSGMALKHDIYLAFWTRNIVPVIDDGVFDEFVKANSWTNAYFDVKDFKFENGFVGKSKIFDGILSGKSGNSLEKSLMSWQLKRAFRKRRELGLPVENLFVTEHILKFHNLDRRKYYRRNWFRKFGKNEKLSRGKFISLISSDSDSL